MRMGKSPKCENSEDSEATLGIQDILDQGEKRPQEFLDVRSEMGDLQGLEEEGNVCGRKNRAGQLSNNETQWVSS